MYNEIINNTELREVFTEIFEFNLINESTVDETYHFTSSSNLLLFAKDGSGGYYSLVKADDIERSKIVYIASEGQAGVICDTFDELVRLITYYPFWRDILMFSGGGKLEHMLSSVSALEEERMDFIEDYKAQQANISSTLGINRYGDEIEKLHRVVTSDKQVSILSVDEDNPYDSLIGFGVM